jgi:hypothetical protein
VELHTLEHALGDLLEWEGPCRLTLLHSSDGFNRGASSLINMYRSIAHKGPTVTLFQHCCARRGSKLVGAYLEKPWPHRNSHIYVSGLRPSRGAD